MSIKITKDLKISTDSSGIVRQLSHSDLYQVPAQELFLTSDSMSLITPRTLAEQYLFDAAKIFGFQSSEIANFSAASEKKPTDVGVELRFKEEKTAGTGVTVAYNQTVFGLPIWGAGVTVRIDGKKMGVTGSHNASHYKIDAHRPSENALYLPYLMDPEKVCSILGIKDNWNKLTINGTRPLVYKYTPDDRFDSQIRSHQIKSESTGLAGSEILDFPTLPLNRVPDIIIPEKHYVVTEVLFTYPYEGWGFLNWRAFLEPDTGAVLYLRALVSCAHGAVFTTDPISATGILHSASTPVNQLDIIRNTVPLLGLKVPSSISNPQELKGEFVQLVNITPPNINMPSESTPYDFLYSCNTPNFAACNAYHHCDGVFRLIKEMGIDVNNYFNNTNFPVSVDPHAMPNVNAAANGNLAGNGLGNLVFGMAKQGSTMGISADVRVVIHEFGHAILWDHVDSPNFGFAHSPGDSLAAILHDPFSKAPDRFETFPFMKASAGLSRRHDRDVSLGWGWFGNQWDEQYGGEQVLSTTLFRVYRAAGGDSSDSLERLFASRYVSYLIFKAVSLLNFTTPDPDVFVAALTEADSSTDLFEGHPGGGFSKIFRWSFEKQGLYQPTPITREGNPPDIDVYIEDGRKGEYMPYLPNFTEQSEIWNRMAADGALTNETPMIGVTNYAYFRIGNRGTQPASGITIKGFQSRIPNPAIWPTDWKNLNSTSTVITLPTIVNPESHLVIGPFAWVPQNADDNLLFSVNALGDRSNLETVISGPISNRRLVMLDNNIAQKSFKTNNV